jgi:multicomponent Na+:H+ antiporter subunit G
LTAAIDILSWLSLIAGAAFCIIGGAGLLRMPDFWTRTHAAGITDTMGAGLILVGLMFQAGLTLVCVKLVMILVFLYLAGPTAGHAIYRAAHAYGVPFGESTVGIDAPEGTFDDSH